jgi:hypothetical protein
MTKNAYLFSWDCTGVEAIIPITQYEDWDTVNAFAVLLRARFNSQRFYEVYAVDCDPGITEQDWRDMWAASPQMCADMIRKRGVCLYGKGIGQQQTVIV